MKNSIIYQGASLIDGAPIVAIAVGLDTASANSKTGALVQTYIIRPDLDPLAAVAAGADFSICGTCPHRGHNGKGRTCYVNLGQGALSVYGAFTRGRYPMADNLAALGRGRIVRLGTYGDPAAVPVEIWRELVRDAVAFTGYTHRWRDCESLRGLCMASVDNEAEAREAAAMGWRYFRVAMPNHAPRTGTERACPASKEAGKLTTCAECRACNGTATGRRASIVIQAHGSAPVMANIRKLSQGVTL